MALGPNMRRVLDSPLGESVVTCLTAGPGDLLVWEVRGSLTDGGDGVPLELVGRGTDLEAAAAELSRAITDVTPMFLGQAELSDGE